MEITNQHFAKCVVCENYQRVRRHLDATNVAAVCGPFIVSRTPQEVMEAIGRALSKRGIASDPATSVVIHIMNSGRPIEESN